jgi:predicted regulator of Ras-like GTPase activity (Roadblock/LC7/MglB family)
VEKEQPQTVFEEVLHRMNEAGGFQASVLASGDGLPIATVPSDYDLQTVAAMVAVLASVAGETQSRVGLGHLDEVSVLADDRVRLVCRYFTTGGEEFILAVVVPPNGCYRGATNSAIREIRRSWRS